MNVFTWIIIGLIAGFVAARLTRAPHGLIRNVIVGLIGALVGGFLFDKLNVDVVVHDFWGSLVTATVGAVVFLLIWQAIRRR